jgi:hypothetical protein
MASTSARSAIFCTIEFERNEQRGVHVPDRYGKTWTGGGVIAAV